MSRGGNLLLDIGPDADGTIPVIMEERLAEIGAWLKVNGEAIYGTRPFTTSKQWSAGERAEDRLQQGIRVVVRRDEAHRTPAPGKASIEAFFTTKGDDVYAILPRWPGRRFTLKDAGALTPKTVTLLGAPGSLRFAKTGTAITIDLPDLPEALLSQPLWVLKLTQ